VQKRDRLELHIMGTSRHYEGADFAKSILRIKGSKCGSLPSWFERNPSAKLGKDPGSYGGQRLILATPKPASNRLNENQ